MKKILLLILILLFVGCTPNKQQIKYDKYLSDLKVVKEATTGFSYNTIVTFDKLTDDEIIYQVVIDDAKINLKDIEVIVYHDQITKDVFPSLGVFDGPYNLIMANEKDTKTNVRGINLVGYIPFRKSLVDFKMTIKVLVIYKENNIVKKDYHIYDFNKK